MHNKRKPTKDCYFCPFIPNCRDRKMAKVSIDKKAKAEKDRVIEQKLMPTYKDVFCHNLFSRKIHRSSKARKLFLKHLHHDYDVRAGVHLWNNPQILEYINYQSLGQNTLSSYEYCYQKLHKKRKRGVSEYHTYRFVFDCRTFTVKTEKSVHGYEQFYALYEERP